MANINGRRILGAAVAGGLAYVGYKAWKRQQGTTSTGTSGGGVSRDPTCLNGILQMGAGVSAKVRSEMNDVALAFLDSLDATSDGSAVNFNANVQYPAWTHALYLAGEPAGRSRDEKIQDLLETAVAPNCDWSEMLAPYTFDQPQSAVWRGAGVLLDLATAQRSVG